MKRMKQIVKNSWKYILNQVMFSLCTHAFTYQQENDNPTEVVRKRIMLQHFRKRIQIRHPI